MPMPTDFTEALADIRGEFGAVATYMRGATEYELDPVSRGKTDFRFVGDDGGAQRVQTVDWLFAFALLAGEELPRKGDRLTEQIGDDIHLYEVTSVNGEPCWSWSDPAKTQIRVHTLFVSKAPA